MDKHLLRIIAGFQVFLCFLRITESFSFQFGISYEPKFKTVQSERAFTIIADSHFITNSIEVGFEIILPKNTCCPILFLAPYPLLHELRHKSCLEYPFLYQFSTVSSLVMVLKPPDPDGQNTNGDQLSIQEINDGKDYLFTGKVKGKLIQKYSL